jgi:predicted Zn-dependent protease
MGRSIKILPLIIAAVVILFQYLGSNKFRDPETGKVHRGALSSGDEATLGLQSYQEVLSTSDVVSSGPDVDLVTRVARRLIPATGDVANDFQWEVSVVRSPQVNAFCLPGGKIVVYTGIIPLAQNEAGLATVMGHEMAHATLHHGSQRLLKQGLMQTAMMGAAAATGSMDNGKRQMVMAALAGGAQFGILLPFSRDQESEADHTGLLYMARAGFDPHEAITFWERMSKSGGAHPPAFMSDHPSDGARIERLKEEMPKAQAAYEQAQRR